MVSGVPMSGTVETNAWQYYHIQVIAGALSVTLAGTEGEQSDCDLFLKYGKLPTGSDYDGRDTGWGSNAYVQILDATPGDWYIGVYGSLTRCHYTVTGATQGGCPGGCGNGECRKDTTGKFSCACHMGYTGEHCDRYLHPTPLPFDEPFQGHSKAKDAWSNYYFDVETDILKIDMVVNVTSVDTGNFYVRQGAAPDFVKWNYLNAAGEKNFVITMQNVTVGRWYIGVYSGENEASYTILLKTENVHCSGECSHRGTCGPPCACKAGYTGDYCQYRIRPLINDETDTGYVETNLLNWFKYNSNTTNDVNIHVEQTGPGDCDLYIKHNAAPTPRDYDDMDISSSTSFDLIITDALTDVIFIAIYGYESCTYNITVSEISKDETCEDGKSCVHGHCQGNDGCVCNAGWVGVECDTKAIVLKNGEATTGTIAQQNDQLYYTFVLHHNTFLVTLKEITPQVKTTGYLYLLMNQGVVPPNLREHDFANYSPNSGFHTITVGFDDIPDSDFPLQFTIAVYGSPYINDAVPFDIVVWEPEFK